MCPGAFESLAIGVACAAPARSKPHLAAMADERSVSLRLRLFEGRRFPKPSSRVRVFAQATVDGEVSL